MSNIEKKRMTIEDRLNSTLAEMAQYGDHMGANEIFNNKRIKQLKMAAGLSKLPAMTMVSGGIADPLLQALTSTTLLADTAKYGKDTAKNQSDAVKRSHNAQNGIGNGSKDNIASINKILGGLSKGTMTGAMASMATGVGGLSLSSALTPAMMAMKGVGALGMTGMTGGIAPIAAAIAAAVGGNKLSNLMQEGSSTKNGSAFKNKNLFTKGTNSHELEDEYSSTTLLNSQITRMLNSGQLTSAEAISLRIAAMTEGHTSVLPAMYAFFKDQESRQNKEGGNRGHKIVEDSFGADGGSSLASHKTNQQTLTSKWLTSMELGVSNLGSINPLAGLANMFAGFKSGTEMYYDANDATKIGEMDAKDKFAEANGLTVQTVDTIHTSAAELIKGADSLDSKKIALLGGIYEQTRGSHIKLIEMVKASGGSTLIGELEGYTEREELANAKDMSPWKQFGKDVDIMLGRIPGYSAISNFFKTADAGSKFLKENISADMFDNSINDWFTKDVTNKNLSSDAKLRKAVGAVELSSTDLMANYLGNAYPDRFELLLEYNLSQKESLEAMSGPIQRNNLTKLTMNKYTGDLDNKQAHEEYNLRVRNNIKGEINSLEESTSLFGEWFASKNKDVMLKRQQELSRKDNGFLDDYLKSTESSALHFIDSGSTNEYDYSSRQSKSNRQQNMSVDDIQQEQENIENQQKKMSIAERQVLLIQEIRDCLNCNRRSSNRRNSGKSNDADSDDSYFGSYGGNGKNRNKKGRNKTHIPKDKRTIGSKIPTAAKLAAKAEAAAAKAAGPGLWRQGAKMAGLAAVTLMSAEVLIPLAAAAAIGYGINELLKSQKGVDLFDETYTRSAKNDGKIFTIESNRLDNLTLAMGRAKGNIKKSKKLADALIKQYANSDTDKLRYLIDTSDNPYIQIAAKRRLKALGKKANLMSSNSLINTHFGENTWEDGAKEYLKTLTSKELETIKVDADSMFTQNFSRKQNAEISTMLINKRTEEAIANNPSNKNNYFNSKITGKYKEQRGANKFQGAHQHKGIDYRAKAGTPIYAMSSGRIHLYTPPSKKGMNPSGWSIKVIDSDNNFIQWLHISRVADGITEGTIVEMGQLIAYSGGDPKDWRSGPVSQKEHVHIQVNVNGKFVDPLPYINKWKTRGDKATVVSSGVIKENKGDQTSSSHESEHLVQDKQRVAKEEMAKTSKRYIAQERITAQLANDGKINIAELMTMQNFTKSSINDTKDTEQIGILKEQLQMLSGIITAVSATKTKMFTLDKNAPSDNFNDILQQHEVKQ